MPWSIRKDNRCPTSKPFGVVKDADNELEGCHTTRENAMSQVAALNAGENKETEEKGYGGEVMGYSMATSFAELEQEEEAREAAMDVQETSEKFQMLVANIMMDAEIEDKGAAVQALAVEFSERVDDVTKEAPKKGFVRRMKDKIIGAIDTTPETKPTSPMLFWKEANGQYRWIARYTNNLRDRDNPPEILSADAHRRFAEMVDNKEVDPPDLWLWHAGENTRWGQADWVAYDDKGDVGFMIAGGLVDKDKGELAEAIMGLDPDSVRVSHGMPVESIKRDPEDNSIITEYITREISPLPKWAAANEYTGFSVLKEKMEMGIPDEKRQALVDWGLSESVLALVEQDNEEVAEEAKEQGLESKEAELETAADTKEEEVEAEIEETPVADAPLTREEVAEALGPIVSALGALNEKIEALSKEREGKPQDELTPAASLLQLTSAIGSKEAKLDERTTLAKKSGPKEAEVKTRRITGIGLVDSLISGKDITLKNAE